MGWGQGEQRKCSKCFRPLDDSVPDGLSFRELRGPRDITGMNIDRYYDDRGIRGLAIEEKWPNELLSRAQRQALLGLNRFPTQTVWVVRGTPACLSITDMGSRDPEPLLRDVTWDDYQQAVFDWYAAGRKSVYGRYIGNGSES